MSCNRCAMEAAATMAAVGVPPDQSMAAWSDYAVGMTWEYQKFPDSVIQAQ